MHPSTETRAAGGLTFAHGLAHLAYFHADGSIYADTRASHEEAVASPCLVSDYHLRNEGVLACAYVDHLAGLHDFPDAPAQEDPEHARRVAAIVARLGG